MRQQKPIHFPLHLGGGDACQKQDLSEAALRFADELGLDDAVDDKGEPHERATYGHRGCV